MRSICGQFYNKKPDLVKAGFLPELSKDDSAKVTLTDNDSGKFECRWVYLGVNEKSPCIFTRGINSLYVPVAHGEGRFLFSKENEARYLKRLYDNDQLVFRYCNQEGEYAEGKYPVNPNGAFHDIAGICDPTGTVFGLMPHPERAFHGWQLPDWTKTENMPEYGDGKQVFESMVEYLKKRF